MAQRPLRIALVSALATLLTACGGGESLEERAERQARYVAEQERERAQSVADFPRLVEHDLLPALRDLSESDVASIEGAVDTVRVFQRARLALVGVESATTPELTSARDELTALLVRKQVALYPAIRRAYARDLGEQIGHTGVRVRTTGSRQKTLQLTSPAFSSVEAATQANGPVMTNATRFRFNQAVYVDPGGQTYEFRLHGADDGALSY